jgi:pimeloyl-ACP methyl ester carboxylesterase
MTVIGKALSAAFYGRKPTTYWSGCSTGGRQGLVAAQQYPELFDGILAGAPAIYWPTYIVAELWPQVVMREAGLYPSQEEFNAVIAAAVTVCDEADGVKDGVVTEPDKCNFDPHSVTGNVNVNGTEVEITPEIADVIKKIWEGPDIDGQKLWYGLPIGSSFDQLANTVVENGTKAGVPFYVANDWTRFFLEQDATYDVSRLDTESLKNLFYSSQIKYDDLINNANPDLSGLQRSGAKLLVWHGGADQIIFPQGTTQYRKRVEDAMGGTATVDEFFRYFLAPGVDHCGIGGAPGAAPTNLLETLIAWTENGTAPVKLHGETPANFPAFTRNICKYPLLPKYTGEGNINSADSFVCV